MLCARATPLCLATVSERLLAAASSLSPCCGCGCPHSLHRPYTVSTLDQFNFHWLSVHPHWLFFIYTGFPDFRYVVTVLSLITTVTVVTVPRVIKEAQYLVRVSQSDDPYLYVAEGLHDLVVSEYAPEATNNSTHAINQFTHAFHHSIDH